MISYSKNHTAHISGIADRLAENFLKPLYNFCNEKNYFVYIGSLAEIIDWAHEFYNQYYYKLDDWETFETSKDNIYNANDRHDFLVAWGQARIEQFFARHANEIWHTSGKTTNFETLIS